MNAIESDLQADVVVVGAGPSGLGLTAALLERGIDARCVAPTLAPWAPTYGSWVDELAGLDVPLQTRWQNALVTFPRHQPVVLDREYARIDSAALFQNWAATVQRFDAFTSGSIASALFSGENFEIRLDSGRSIFARQVFDSSGHRPVLVDRAPMGPAFQTAFGVTGRCETHTLSHSTMGLMLWDNGLIAEDAAARIPAFYYVMPENDGNTFCEYTVLAARPMMSVEAISRRVVADHVSSDQNDAEVERCIIPMGYPVPRLKQRIVGFGGAASMVHPATGYMVARVLRTIPVLAEAYVALQDRPIDERARALWDVVWPTQLIRTHELYQFGLEALLTMDVEQTHQFFSAFFSLPDELWRPYQAGTATPGEVARAMWEVFTRVDAPLKRKLVATGLGPHLGKLGRLVF